MYSRYTVIAPFQVALRRPCAGVILTAALAAFTAYCSAATRSPIMAAVTKAAYVATAYVLAATGLGITMRLSKYVRWKAKHWLKALRTRRRSHQHIQARAPWKTPNMWHSSPRRRRQEKEPHPQHAELLPIVKYYRVLSIPPDASTHDVRAAYLSLIKEWHPDHYLSNPERLKIAEERTKEINAAYNEINRYHNKNAHGNK